MFKDLYYLINNNICEIKVNEIYNLSSYYKIFPYVYYMLYYTGILFYDRIFDKLIVVQDDTILNLYNSENGQDACCSGSNGQCLC